MVNELKKISVNRLFSVTYKITRVKEKKACTYLYLKLQK